MSLELEHVFYTYGAGGPEESHALKDVSLIVPEHSFVGLVGHTGSGKSTMVQVMNGLLKPTSGRVLVDGFDLSDKSKEVRESFIFSYNHQKRYANGYEQLIKERKDMLLN